jgi:hypothetical protein
MGPFREASCALAANTMIKNKESRKVGFFMYFEGRLNDKMLERANSTKYFYLNIFSYIN